MTFEWLLLLKSIGAWALDKRYYVLFCTIFFVGGCKFGTWKTHVFGENEQPVAAADEGERSFGWINNPDLTSDIVKSFPARVRYFGDAAKDLVRADENKDGLLYKNFKAVAGHDWIPHNQASVGSCVGQGLSGAIEILTTVQISLGENDEYHPISAAAAYALSREVAGILGNRDGSSGAAAAKAAMTMGSISCQDAGDDNQDTSIGPALCKKWGRTGLPEDKKRIAVKHIVKTAAQVRTPEEARAAVINGYPITIASNIGFEGRGGFRRDKDGFCYAGGSWPHQMFVAGYRADKKAFLVFQSWGASSPPGPKTMEQPDGTFWITWRDMQRILAEGESYALSGFDGYPKQAIDVFIRRDIDQRQLAAQRLQCFTLAP